MSKPHREASGEVPAGDADAEVENRFQRCVAHQELQGVFLPDGGVACLVVNREPIGVRQITLCLPWLSLTTAIQRRDDLVTDVQRVAIVRQKQRTAGTRRDGVASLPCTGFKHGVQLGSVAGKHNDTLNIFESFGCHLNSLIKGNVKLNE